MKITLGVLMIGVKDLNKARPFFENVFGMKIVEFRPPFMQGLLGDVEFNIEEDAPYREKDWAVQNIGNRKTFTFQVDDVFEFQKNAEKYGAKIIMKPTKQAWGWYDSVIADPDGNEYGVEQEIK